MVGPIVQTSGGPFTTASLSGATVLGLQTGVFPIAQAGIINWDGAGNFTLHTDQNDRGTMSAPSYGGTYTVAADGRVTVASLSIAGQSGTAFLYLTGPNQGFITGPAYDLAYGQLLDQTGGPFSNASFSGSYLGLNSPMIDENIDFELDTFSASGAGSLTGTSYLDNFINGPTITPVTATYTVSSSGRGVVTESGATTAVFYVVSPTQVLWLPYGDAFPKLVDFTHP
jgi:hypothetical protein